MSTTTGEITTRESYRDVVRRLGAAQKGRAAGAPAYSIYVNRPLGRLFAAAAFRAGLTPNQVTAISAVVTFAGIAGIALLPSQPWIGIPVGLALVIGYALDSADGQVARLRGGGSAAGEWLDHVIDSIKNAALHVAVVIALYRVPGLPRGWLLVPLIYGIVATVAFFAMILNDQLKAVQRLKAGIPTPPRQSGSLLKSIVLLSTDYGVLCVVFLTLGLPVVFLVLYGLMALAQTGHLALALRKWFGDMRALDAETAR